MLFLSVIILEILQVVLRSGSSEALTTEEVVAKLALKDDCIAPLKPPGLFKKKPPLPAHCGEPHSKSSGTNWVALIAQVLSTFAFIIATLDVPIFFCTGAINEANGLLEARPFFERWVLPGVLIQLIVNPGLEPLSKFVSDMVSGTAQVGLGRVLRALHWTKPLHDRMFKTLRRKIQKFLKRSTIFQQTDEMKELRRQRIVKQYR